MNQQRDDKSSLAGQENHFQEVIVGQDFQTRQQFQTAICFLYFSLNSKKLLLLCVIHYVHTFYLWHALFGVAL